MHIKIYVTKELNDYQKNKLKVQALLQEASTAKSLISTKSILIATQRIHKIETVFNRLHDEDKKAVELIFFKQHSQIYAQVNDNITKDMYYNAKNKMLYLTALEFDLI